MDGRPIHIPRRCGNAPGREEFEAPPFRAKRSSPSPRPHQQQLTAPAGCRGLASFALASSDYETSSGLRALPQEMQVAGLRFESINPARQQHAATQVRCRTSFGVRSFLEVVILPLLFAICCLPIVSCIKEHAVVRQAEIGATVNADLVSPAHTGDIVQKLSAVIESQLSQMENQRRLEALATPFVAHYPNLSAGAKSAIQTPDEAEGQLTKPSMVELGSLLSTGDVGESTASSIIASSIDSSPLAEVDGVSNADTEKPFSFLNWGQVGGLMQSPALAHTGVGVQMPRQVVGTTVGLDFDSPATFHGPLLVALMKPTEVKEL
ncbi:hypothetical protein Esti_005535 [Eimeria stiedai]